MNYKLVLILALMALVVLAGCAATGQAVGDSVSATGWGESTAGSSDAQNRLLAAEAAKVICNYNAVIQCVPPTNTAYGCTYSTPTYPKKADGASDYTKATLTCTCKCGTPSKGFDPTKPRPPTPAPGWASAPAPAPAPTPTQPPAPAGGNAPVVTEDPCQGKQGSACTETNCSGGECVLRRKKDRSEIPGVPRKEGEQECVCSTVFQPIK